MILFISPKYGSRADSVKLIEAARKHHIRTETLLNNWNRVIAVNEKTALYGERAFCEFMAQEMRWNLYQNSLNWIAGLPHAFIKRSIKYMSLEGLQKLTKSDNSICNKRILEPADEPLFSTGIYTRLPRVPSDTPILVSSVCEWAAKFRFVIIDGKVATSCCFQIESIFNEPVIWQTNYERDGITADAFVHTLLNHVNTAPGCVIDVGYIKGSGWAVVGTQPIWSAELYGCRPTPFLNALFEACKQHCVL